MVNHSDKLAKPGNDDHDVTALTSYATSANEYAAAIHGFSKTHIYLDLFLIGDEHAGSSSTRLIKISSSISKVNQDIPVIKRQHF